MQPLIVVSPDQCPSVFISGWSSPPDPFCESFCGRLFRERGRLARTVANLFGRTRTSRSCALWGRRDACAPRLSSRSDASYDEIAWI